LNQLDRQRLFYTLQRIGCIPCRRRGRLSVPGDMHHPTVGGHHGAPRLSDDIVLNICPWHHRGVPMFDMDHDWCRCYMGPSYALEPNAFREEFGSEEELLAERNRLIERYDQNLVGGSRNAHFNAKSG
jgi:hypothetical protein